jgi:beta-glucanase (GH16 family)
LVLNSPFTGTTLDTQLWRSGWFGTGITGPVNSNETTCYSSGNVTMPGDGSVYLSITKQHSRCGTHNNRLTGALLSSNPHDGRAAGGFAYRYGVLEVKVWIPGNGRTITNWPAVLTLGQIWPDDGEDDVMESLAGEACTHFHSHGFTGGANGTCDPGLTPGWHIVAADWEPGSVTYYDDGVAVFRTTQGITRKPMYIVVLNTASRKWPNLTTPSSMRVAYVRVWQHPTAIAARVDMSSR